MTCLREKMSCLIVNTLIGESPMNSNDLAAILKQIVQHFVGNPGSVEVTSSDSRGGRGTGTVTELLLRGHAQDQGRLIGTSGRNAIAFQTIMQEIGNRYGQKVYVQILEPVSGGTSQSVPFQYSDDVERDTRIKELLDNLMGKMFDPKPTVTLHTTASGQYQTTEFLIHLKQPISPHLEASLTRVFSGIGKNFGRLLSVKLCPHESVAV